MSVVYTSPTGYAYPSGTPALQDVFDAAAANAPMFEKNATNFYEGAYYPTPDDDESNNGGRGIYTQGSRWMWINEGLGIKRAFYCIDGTPENAVWVEVPITDNFDYEAFVPKPINVRQPENSTQAWSFDTNKLFVDGVTYQKEGLEIVDSLYDSSPVVWYYMPYPDSHGFACGCIPEFRNTNAPAVLFYDGDISTGYWTILENHKTPHAPEVGDVYWHGPQGAANGPVGTYTKIGSGTQPYVDAQNVLRSSVSFDGSEITLIDFKTQQQLDALGYDIAHPAGDNPALKEIVPVLTPIGPTDPFGTTDPLSGSSTQIMGSGGALEPAPLEVMSATEIYNNHPLIKGQTGQNPKSPRGGDEPETVYDFCLFYSLTLADWIIVEGTTPSETADYSIRSSPAASKKDPSGSYSGDAGDYTIGWRNDLTGETYVTGLFEAEELSLSGDLSVTGQAESAAFKYLDATTGATDTLLVGVNAGGSRSGTIDNCVCVGHNAGQKLTNSTSVEGRGNTFIGAESGLGGTTNKGTYNTAVGWQSNYSVTTGCSNTALGVYALRYATSASDNVAVGRSAGHLLTSGSANVFLGNSAGYNQTTNSNRLIIDNQNRGSTTAEYTNALIHGEFNSTLANQWLRINVGGFCFNGTPVSIPITAGAATAGGTWGTNEATMLQKVYDALRSIGVLT